MSTIVISPSASAVVSSSSGIESEAVIVPLLSTKASALEFRGTFDPPSVVSRKFPIELVGV